jgi:hypothetical protein
VTPYDAVVTRASCFSAEIHVAAAKRLWREGRRLAGPPGDRESKNLHDGEFQMAAKKGARKGGKKAAKKGGKKGAKRKSAVKRASRRR